MKRKKLDNAVRLAAQLKQYVVYGVSLAYPVISLVTFLGVVKLAFDVPPEMAAVIAFVGVLVLGVISFKSGLYAHDMNISWKNTPMAVDIHERTDRIEKDIIELNKKIEEQTALIKSLKGKV